MDLWFNERETDNIRVQWKVVRHLYSTASKFQRIDVVDLAEFGRTLVLDGIIQTTYTDEFIYHEMLAHVPLASIPEPRRVLVIGGGDGGTVREVLKHPVDKVDLVEIDGEVIRVSKEFLPRLASALNDPRVCIHVEDAIEYVKSCSDKYDCVLVDSSDPVGPAVGLFSEEFYRNIAGILSPDGILAAQTESPLFNQELIKGVFTQLKGIFPQTSFYWCNVPSYSIGPWSFALAKKTDSPRGALRNPEDCRYYTEEIYQAAFTLPGYFKALLKE